MSKNTDEIFGFDYPDLESSDQQQQKKHQDKEPTGDPTKKTKIDQSIQKNNQAQTKSQNNPTNKTPPNISSKPQMPFFPPPPPGSRSKPINEWVPPPPMSQSHNQNYNKHHYNQPYQKNYGHSKNYDANRDKKTVIYVKNIPKSYSTQQKLMTFFKNQGVIKQIKVNDVQQSAVIKFAKQQNAAKFLKSGKVIFNRSFIVYGDQQNITVTQQQVNDRISDQQGIVKKAQQTNLKVIKQKVSNQISQQIRALYFLQNYLNDDQNPQTVDLKEEVLRQKQMKISTKKNLQNLHDDKFNQQSFNENQYDWTLIFNRKAPSLQKKTLFAQFLKYGPIINLQYQCLGQQKNNSQTQKKEDQIKSNNLNDYKIKLLFLSLKNTWNLYSTKKQQMDLTVQGKQIKKYFQSGKLKMIQTKKSAETDKEAQKEINQNEQKLQKGQQDTIKFGQYNNTIQQLGQNDENEQQNNKQEEK